MLIWRAGGDLFFASFAHLEEGLKVALAVDHPPARHVLLDADSINFIDTSACDALLNSIKELQSQDISVAFARVRDEVRERMRLGGIEALSGDDRGEPPKTDRALPGAAHMERYSAVALTTHEAGRRACPTYVAPHI